MCSQAPPTRPRCCAGSPAPAGGPAKASHCPSRRRRWPAPGWCCSARCPTWTPRPWWCRRPPAAPASWRSPTRPRSWAGRSWPTCAGSARCTWTRGTTGTAAATGERGDHRGGGGRGVPVPAHRQPAHRRGPRAARGTHHPRGRPGLPAAPGARAAPIAPTWLTAAGADPARRAGRRSPALDRACRAAVSPRRAARPAGPPPRPAPRAASAPAARPRPARRPRSAPPPPAPPARPAARPSATPPPA